MSKWQVTICFFFIVLVAMHLVIFRRLNTNINLLDLRVQAIERSVDILPGNNPTERVP